VAAMARYLRPAGKPDLDNSLKAIADSCLTGIVIHDDRQIVEVHLAKWYDENPRVEIDVAPWMPTESRTLFSQE
jgi:Holliday junction resolvase RusA-like endonuclease